MKNFSINILCKEEDNFMIAKTITQMHSQTLSGSHLILIRITLGVAFLYTLLENYMKSYYTTNGYTTLLKTYIDNNIQTLYNTIVTEILIPNAVVFSFIQLILEMFVAISLIFGIFTRLGSIIGSFLIANIFLITLGIDWPWTYIIMIAGFLTCLWTDAGRWYGIDFWLKNRLPKPISILC